MLFLTERYCVFKNLQVYVTNKDWHPSMDTLEEGLAKTPYVPCTAGQAQSFGWVPPRGDEHAALVETVSGQRILKFCIETKSVPRSVLERRLKERLKVIEQTEGRKPGRKEVRDIKEELTQDLLPVAPSKITTVLVWLDPEAGRLCLDIATASKADVLITELVKTFSDLQVSLLQTKVSPKTAMTTWLTGELDQWPGAFIPGREVELKAADESKSVVRFGSHHLDVEQMSLHISQGKLPTKLAMSWGDRVSFLLTESMTLKKIVFLDGAMEDTSGTQDKQDNFDGDMAIATGELSGLLNDLLGALGDQEGEEV